MTLNLLRSLAFPTLGSCGRTELHGQSLPSSTLLSWTLLPSLPSPRQDPSPSSPGAEPLSHPPQLDGVSHFPRQIQATFQRPRQDVPRHHFGFIPKGPNSLQVSRTTQKNRASSTIVISVSSLLLLLLTSISISTFQFAKYWHVRSSHLIRDTITLQFINRQAESQGGE